MWRTAFAVALLASVAAAPALPLPPPYYMGEVLPTPKEATYFDGFVRLYDVEAAQPMATIVIDSEAPSSQRLGAEELAARVAELAGADEPIPITARIPTGRAIVRLTCRPGAMLPEGDAEAVRALGDQGYVIRSLGGSPCRSSWPSGESHWGS
ncbi:MAG: hypothetical protein ACE5JM_16905, partial [Armatimonadota bacterium]